MKSGLGRALSWGGLFALGLIMAQGRALAGNCVAYARAETGVALFGNAGGWWNEAAGVYQRGHVPEVGSILVFQRTGFMPAGHVAVVSKVIGPGQILVDQSNWYHGEVTHDTPVIDTSPDHDWTSVAVMNIGSGEFGRDSPTYGFVYPGTGSPGAVAVGGFDPGLVNRAAYAPETGDSLLRSAVGDDNWQGHLRFSSARSRVAERSSRRRGPRRMKISRFGHRWVPHSAHAVARHAINNAAHSAGVHERPAAGHRPLHAASQKPARPQHHAA
jgi:surface antigen